MFQRRMGVMEERRSLADGEEEEEEGEEEAEDMSPQKLRTMIKEGIEVAILITTLILNMKMLTTTLTRTTQRKVLCFPLLPMVAGAGLLLLLLSAAIWYLFKIPSLTLRLGSL